MEFVIKGRPFKVKNKCESLLLESFTKQWEEYVDIMKNHKYMFPKAHCCNYVVMCMWLAWYKIYYLEQFDEIINKESV